MESDEVHYRLMKLIERHPRVTQRELAVELGISLGKVNYCLGALVKKGHIKLDTFRRNPNKRHYIYLLTPSGIEFRARATVRFLRRKVEEYEMLKREIDVLKTEIESSANCAKSDA